MNLVFPDILFKRRAFLTRSAQGVGGLALASLLQEGLLAKNSSLRQMAPKAKRVIYLFQSGGPSHLDLFDHKPHLEKVHGHEVPDWLNIDPRRLLNDMRVGQDAITRDDKSGSRKFLRRFLCPRSLEIRTTIGREDLHDRITNLVGVLSDRRERNTAQQPDYHQYTHQQLLCAIEFRPLLRS